MDQCDVSNANGVRREEGQGEGGGGRAEGGCQLEIDVSTTLSLPLFALGLLPPPAARSTPSLTPPSTEFLPMHPGDVFRHVTCLGGG